jgi:hypothetical protein
MGPIVLYLGGQYVYIVRGQARLRRVKRKELNIGIKTSPH